MHWLQVSQDGPIINFYHGLSVVCHLTVNNGELLLLGVTADALRANIGSKSAISLQRRPANLKFQVEGVAAH